jgi:23S rRNA pseudouridine2604 synthase
VFINDRLAVLGDKVNEDDEVRVKNTKGAKKVRLYFAYNKPRGVITHSPGDDDTDIREEVSKFPELRGTFPVGRLDKDSYGLIILTNDGRITDRLLNPKYVHEKEYIVKTKEHLREGFAKRMEAGVAIEGYQTKPCIVRIVNENTFSITLTEGKKHQIRRMVVAMRNEVLELKRVRIMNVTLGKMKEGAFRTIEGEELELFVKSLGM